MPRRPVPSCLNKKQPIGFDLQMEILMTVPVAGSAPLAILAQDFALTLNEARHAVASLVDCGIQLFTEKNSVERVSMKRSHRTRNAEIGEKYFDRVYSRLYLPSWKLRDVAVGG